MLARVLVAIAIALTATSATAQSVTKPTPSREPPVWQSLERFESDADFVRYVRQVQRLSGQRYYANGFADSAIPPPPPPPPAPPPPPMAGAAPSVSARAQEVVVTGASSQPSADGELSSITNVQTQGVDEGGIVKQIGRFLIVLQDGRLFVVDTRAEGGQGLALVNRANVYRKPGQDTWYDELLTSGNRILVTGYSYAENASEVTVFTLSDDGQLAREATYYISSNDYYDVENYATRLVGGNLVIYTPLDVASINPDAQLHWPLVRRWVRDEDHRAVTTDGRALFDARDIYRPVQSTYAPMVHSVSVCPLGGDLSGDELECRTTAFVGASQREFFVSTTDIYLWVTSAYGDEPNRRCHSDSDPSSAATLFQVPLGGQTPRAIHTRGSPITQLALDADTNEFRALLSYNTGPCNRAQTADTRYFRVPLSALSTTPAQAPARSYTQTPSPGTSHYEVRFTGAHVVYGAREEWRSGAPEAGAEPLTARVVAVPLARPQNARVLQAPHNVLRVERAGGDVILTGYRTDAGLSVSLLDLARTPRIVQTQVLDNRYESEGRSHAFNALVGPEGDGIMGLPTVSRVKEGDRWWWRSEASDLTFLTVDARNHLASAGELLADPAARDASYRCEVSCVDWYGNSRALFIGQRVFALSATELIEGTLENGRIAERRRLNLSRPFEARAAAR